MNLSAPGARESHRVPMRTVRVSPWVIVALLLLPAAGCIWFGAVSVDPLAIDLWWQDIVIANAGSLPFSFARFLHIIGNGQTMSIIGVCVIVVFAVMQWWREAVAVALTLLGVLILVAALKTLVHRPRPTHMLVEQGETSFPSGHSLGAAALMTILVCVIAVHSSSLMLERSAIVVAVVYLLAMMWSRTALNVHWLSDTVCAASLGIALGLVIARYFLRVPDIRLLAPGTPPRTIV